LDRAQSVDCHLRPLRALRDRFDLLLCLRWDAIIKSHLDEAGISYHASESEDLDVHVAVEQRMTLLPWTGGYDLLSSYNYSKRLTPIDQPRTVGLCISAGFPLNAWPLSHWLELAMRLRRRRMEPVLIGGPQERTRLYVLADALDSSGNAPLVLVGDENFGRFLCQVAGTVDVVIASDSGTAHLLSLVRPVLSLFGGSPWRRFAPLGRHNAVVSRQLPCSPCPQFDRTLINTCVKRECLTNLQPDQVEACLDTYLDGLATVEPRLVRGAWLARAPWEAESSRLAATPA
jgi:heptosyltransferase-2